MAETNRPLSPHLQIYKLPITPMTSITHRATGIALSVGTIMLVCWLAAAAAGPEAFESMQSYMGSFIGRVLLFGWTLALCYHLCNGIRHLFWDMGHGFSLPTVHKTGPAVIGGAVGLTLLVWIAGYFVA